MPFLVFIIVFGLLNLIFGDKYIIAYGVVGFLFAVATKIIHGRYYAKDKLEVKEEEINTVLRIL